MSFLTHPLAQVRSQLGRVMRLGLKSLWRHRLRSLLTVLGIVFGVCSVIAMLAIGEGASYEAQQQIKSLGSHNILVRSVRPPEEEKVTTQASQSYVLDYSLKYADVSRIEKTIPGVAVVVPARIIREYVWNISRRIEAEVLGTVPSYPAMRHHPVARGRFFTELEMEKAENVCVLGAEMAERLFPLEEPIGASVKVLSDYYRVIGVMAPRAFKLQAAQPGARASAAAAADEAAATDRMFIPLTTARARFGEILARRRSGTFEAQRVQLHELTVKVDRLENVLPVAATIKDMLEKHHQKKDWEVVVPLELLNQAERTKRIFNIVLGSIAAISLLVGGIGIMNIMLASVTERTREIGIRRALGAKRRDIVIQFLVETVMLAGTGGLIGVLLGLAVPTLVTLFSDMKTIVAVWSPLMAFGLSALVGIVFGLYPALRAAHMDPVEALRHE